MTENQIHYLFGEQLVVDVFFSGEQKEQDYFQILFKAPLIYKMLWVLTSIGKP